VESPRRSAGSGMPCTSSGEIVRRVGRDLLRACRICTDPSGASTSSARTQRGDHRRIKALRVLPRTRDVEIPQTDGLHVAACERRGKDPFACLLAA
jgi:hypothetical protein